MPAESVASAPQEPAKTTSEESVASMSVQPETSNSEQSTTNSSDEAMRVIALDNVFGNIPDITDDEKSLVDAFADAKRFRAFFGHGREKQKNLIRFRSSYRQQSTPAADDNDAKSSDGEHLEFWNPANVSWPADDPQSQILVNNDGHVLVQTSVLSRFSWEPYRRIIRQHGPVKIDAFGFGRKTADNLNQFISGEHQLPIEWLASLAPIAKLDLVMLSYHLYIPALQALLMDDLARFLLDDGNCPNYWMMLYVWNLSHPEDPLRRLLLASFYIQIIVIGTDFKIWNPDRRLKMHDYGKGMWLDELHRLLESNLDYDKFAGAEDDFIPHARRALWYKAWKTEIMGEKSHWAPVLGIVRDARERGCFEETGLFFFVNPCGDADLSTRLQTLADQRYLIYDQNESMDLPVCFDEDYASKFDHANVPRGEYNDHGMNARDRDNSILAFAEDQSSVKRKYSELDQASDEIISLFPIKRSRLHRPKTSDIVIQCKDGAKHRILRTEFVHLSRAAQRCVEKRPRNPKLSFPHVTQGQLEFFIAATEDLNRFEKLVGTGKAKVSMLALLHLIITTEELDSPTVESRLLPLLRMRFKTITMNVRIAEFAFENTKRAESKLRTFVAECLHWVMMNKGLMSLGQIYTICHATSKLGAAMAEKLLKLHEVWDEKRLGSQAEPEAAVAKFGVAEQAAVCEKGKVKSLEGADNGVGMVEKQQQYPAEGGLGWDSEHSCYGMAWDGALIGSLPTA